MSLLAASLVLLISIAAVKRGFPGRVARAEGRVGPC